MSLDTLIDLNFSIKNKLSDLRLLALRRQSPSTDLLAKQLMSLLSEQETMLRTMEAETKKSANGTFAADMLVLEDQIRVAQRVCNFEYAHFGPTPSVLERHRELARLKADRLGRIAARKAEDDATIANCGSTGYRVPLHSSNILPADLPDELPDWIKDAMKEDKRRKFVMENKYADCRLAFFILRERDVIARVQKVWPRWKTRPNLKSWNNTVDRAHTIKRAIDSGCVPKNSDYELAKAILSAVAANAANPIPGITPEAWAGIVERASENLAKWVGSTIPRPSALDMETIIKNNVKTYYTNQYRDSVHPANPIKGVQYMGTCAIADWDHVKGPKCIDWKQSWGFCKQGINCHPHRMDCQEFVPSLVRP